MAEHPADFEYPPEFLRVVDLGLLHFEPWHVLTDLEIRQRVSGLRSRYTDESYIPFAARQDCDDLACWIGRDPIVVLVHDFASPGWERPGTGHGRASTPGCAPRWRTSSRGARTISDD